MRKNYPFVLKCFHQSFEIVIYTQNNLYFILLTPALFLCNIFDFSLAQFYFIGKKQN